MPNIPASMNLGILPIGIPSIMFRGPREGPQSVDYTARWSEAIARGLTCFSVNMQDGGTLEFSQICGLIVDNSNCGSDLDFIFPDTNVVVSIPAYAPYTCLQVNTQQVQFYVRALNPLAIDETYFTVLNYAPAPVAVPITIQQQQAVVGSIAIDGASTTAIVAPGVSGTVRSLAINAAWNSAAAGFNNLLQVVDGAGQVLWGGNIAGQSGNQTFSAMLANLGNISLRFQNGLNLVQSGGFVVGGTIGASIYYVRP